MQLVVSKQDAISSIMNNLNWINGQYGSYTQPLLEKNKIARVKEKEYKEFKKEYDKNEDYFTVTSKAINVNKHVFLLWEDNYKHKESQIDFLERLFKHLGYNNVKSNSSYYRAKVTINDAVDIDIGSKSNNITNNKARNNKKHWVMRITQIQKGYQKDKFIVFNLESPINLQKLISDLESSLSTNIFIKNEKSLDLRRVILINGLKESIGMRDEDNINYSHYSLSNKLTVPRDKIVDYSETEIKETYNLHFNNLSTVDIQILYPIIKGVLLNE